MSRRNSLRQSDVTRALKGAHAAGLSISRLEITSQGSIIMVVSGAKDVAPELDEWLRGYARKIEGDKQRKKDFG
jgi:hypothetical protein